MKRYRVALFVHLEYETEVEADSKDAAAQLALDKAGKPEFGTWEVRRRLKPIVTERKKTADTQDSVS